VPVRFQVDGDFYDHPKTLGMSDHAVALWTRAGSYSVAKRTDGFIAEHVLAILTKHSEAAEELVTRDLWRRVKGGYKFHQWGDRNLTKAKIDAFTDGARSRKRKQRERERAEEKPQVSPENVTPESRDPVTRDKSVSHANVTPLSLSVSLSESVSNTAAPDGFVDFWSAYPRKVGKAAAAKAWRKAVDRGVDPDSLTLAATRYSESNANTDPKFICHPTTWLNQGRYEDETEPEASPAPRRYPPTEVPDWLDPNDPQAYSDWYTENMR
jgi:hypothetical protein